MEINKGNGVQRTNQATATSNSGSKHSLQMGNGNNDEGMSTNSRPALARHRRFSSRILEITRNPNSLFILSDRNPIRRLSKFIVEHKAFEYFILTNIVANCVVLAMNKPLPGEDKIEFAKQLDNAEIYFVAIFCIEAVLKILAIGFVLHPGSYLRNGWNILDFVVVVVGVISLPDVNVPSDVDVKALRAVRVLRPIKLISGVPSLQVVMKSIGRAMVPLLQIALLVLFVIVIYAIIGIEFLRKQFHSTCFNNITNEMETNPQPCDPPPHNGIRAFFKGRNCPDGWRCDRFWEGPDNGISTFDNIALSMLTVFQCITMEGWTTIMYTTFMAIDADGYLYACYFVSLIVIGSFFMLNLVLGVLSGEFAKERERVETRREFFKVRRQQQLDRQVAGYLEWMSKADEIRLREESRGESITNISDTDTQAHVVGSDITTGHANGERIHPPERRGCSMESFHLLQSRFKLFIRKCVKSQWFYWLVLICVFLNTISLSTEHYDQPKWLDQFQDYAEKVFLVIFILEMVLKMYSLGFDVYFSSSFNIFDCVVVCSGILESVLNLILSKPINLGLSVLRCVRLLRIFKVTRHWTSLRNLATSLVSSIKSIMSLIFLLFLFILISALLGMQIFGGKFITSTKTPRTNFDSFPNAMLTVFQILTGEDWNGVMRQGMIAYGGPHKPWGLVVSLYFVLLVIVGNYTLLNVFLAIAVDNLANAQILTQDEEQEEKEKFMRRSENREKFAPPPEPEVRRPSKWGKTKSIPVMLAIKNFVRDKPTNIDQPDYDGVGNFANRRTDRRFSAALVKGIEAFQKAEKTIAADVDTAKDSMSAEEDGRPSSRKRRVRERRGGRRRTTSSNDGKETEDDEEDEENPRITAKNFMKVLRGGRLGNRRRRGRKTKKIIQTRTFFIFSPDNRFRRLCHSLVNLAHFDTVMLVVIGLSSITIAAEDPLNDDAPRNAVLWYFDIVFTAIFCFEVVVKLVDMGLVFHKGAYLRDWWNVIDSLVVVCNIASLVLTKSNISGPAGSWIKALRVVRVLRPFKSVHKIKKLQAVFRCMLFSVKNVANILMITGFFLLIFAVIGVQLFNGKFFYCTDESKLYKTDCKGQFFTFDYNKDGIPINPKNPTVRNRVWSRRELNFDNVAEAMLTLYTSSTGEGWPTAMHRTMDTTEKDKGPIQDYSTEYAIFYVSFVVVFSFFFLNIFVALIILTFQDLGEKEISNCELDRNQRDCIHFALSAKPAQLYKPRDEKGFQYRVWCVASSKHFDAVIMVLIALNSVVLMMQYYDQPKSYEDACTYLNIGFTTLFTLEAVIKITALRINYFRDYWNIFDFVIVLGGLLDMGFTTYEMQTEDNNVYMPFDPTMFRLFRAARLIKLLRQGYTIRILLWTFLRSFKALPYVTLLIMLQFFMYAVIGMQLFGKIATDNDTQINQHNNFRNIFQALQVLFRSATGEDWHLVMSSCFTDAKCAKEANLLPDAKCGSTPLAIIYFCSFIFMCMFLMLNLFVAVIMDNFEYLTRDESILGPHHLDEFVRVWSEYDNAATGFIHHDQVYKMMCSMSPPVGFGKKCPRIVGYKRLIKMNMPLDENNNVTFSTTLFALIRISLNIKLSGNMNANDTELRKLIKRLWPNSSPPKVLDKLIPKQSVLSSQQMTIGKIYCAKLIHENYKYSKRKAEGGYQPGLLRRIVGSIRGKNNRDSTTLSATDSTYDPTLLSPRPRSRTLEIPDSGNSISADHSTEVPGNHPKQGNSVARSHSWGSQPNGDIEMKEIKPTVPRDNELNPSSPPIPLRNGRTRKTDGESNGPVVPITYLTASPRPGIRRHLNVDYSSLDDVTSSQPISDSNESKAQSPAKSRDNRYYDDMITRINEQLADAVDKGQSPYAIYGLEDDDESEWC